MSAPAPAIPRVSTEEFTALVEEMRPKWINCIMKRGFDRGTAEDIASEATLRGWRFLPKFQGVSSLRTWMWTILMNETRQHLRLRRSRIITECIDTELFRSDAITEPETATRSALLGEMRECINHLPAHYRDALNDYLSDEYEKPPMPVRLAKLRAVSLLAKRFV